MITRDIVIFDLGNVLIDFDPRHVYREYFDGDEEALQHFFDSRAMWDILDHGHNTLDAWDTAFDDLKAKRPELSGQIDIFCRDWFKFLLGPMQPTVDLFYRLLYQSPSPRDRPRPRLQSFACKITIKLIK